MTTSRLNFDLTRTVNMLLVVSFFILISAIIDNLKTKGSVSISNTEIETSLKERDLAIYLAKKNNRSEYNFTTKFIPTIGYIENPEGFLENIQNSSQEPAD